ncbi:uncharacterized protein LOC141898601 isoform X2 [Tubulanus polymorphus]|uniref:uncharacterized protein LOC141898601 isoform X2 n=1 Tax=Tubulanus polymorphus TaxID=672921 RepID=UPI003DA491FF
MAEKSILSGTYCAPTWLLNSKDNVIASKDWNAFVGELHDTIQQQLTESHVHQFTDLSESEKELFMERAAKALHGGSAFNMLYGKISSTLDQQLNGEVARQLLEEFPINTKSDLIVDSAKEGAVSILRKWPEFKYKLHVCLNQALPGRLRELAWKLFLDNPKVRKQYVDLLANNPRAAISRQDFDISQQCEVFLNAEKSFDLIKGSIGAFYAMKAVLSYHHALKNTDMHLSATEYLLTAPFLHVSADKIPRRDPASSRVVALLVEEYLSFLFSRPKCMVDTGDEPNSDDTYSFSKKTAQYLTEYDPELAKAISEMPIPSPTPPESEDEDDVTLPPTPAGPSIPETPYTPTDPPPENAIDAKTAEKPEKKNGDEKNETEGKADEKTTESKKTDVKEKGGGKKGKKNDKNQPTEPTEPTNEQNNAGDTDSFHGEKEAQHVLSDIILHLVRPCIRSLFIGYLNIDTILYVWDQYMIGLDSPGYHDELLPALTAVFLMLLSDKLKEASSLPFMHDILKHDGMALKKEHFQYLMNRHFYKDLYDVLTKDTKAALPVIDPTQARPPSWEHWSKEVIPPRIRPEDRKSLRQQREEERIREIERVKEEEKKREEERQRVKREREELEKKRIKDAQEAEEKRKHEEEKMYLIDLVEEERKRRVEEQQKAADEMENLRKQMLEMQRQLQEKEKAELETMRSPRDISYKQSEASILSTDSHYVPPPPPSEATHLSQGSTSRIEPRHYPDTPQEEGTGHAVIDFFHRAGYSARQINNGDDNEMRALDEETRSQQRKLQSDYKEAERQVFGRTLQPGEMDTLGEDEREIGRAKMPKAILDIYHQRKQRELTDNRNADQQF